MQQIQAGKIASKWYKMARSHPTGHLKAPQCFNGVSQWLKSSNTPFYKPIPHFTQFLGPVLPQIAVNSSGKNKRDKMRKMGYPNGGPQWVNGVFYLPVHPIWQAKYHFTTSFCWISMTLRCSSSALPQAAQPLPATGLFWARLSALDTPTCVFPTHLWTFWYQIHPNQTLGSILKV